MASRYMTSLNKAAEIQWFMQEERVANKLPNLWQCDSSVAAAREKVEFQGTKNYLQRLPPILLSALNLNPN